MKIFCIGRNYAEHAKELNNAVPIAGPMIRPSEAIPWVVPRAAPCSSAFVKSEMDPSDDGLVRPTPMASRHCVTAIAKIEYANALVILEGDRRMAEATRYYEQAASAHALDAAQRLDVDMAQTELAN